MEGFLERRLEDEISFSRGNLVCHVSFQRRKNITLPETNSLHPQKQWLEDDVSRIFLLGPGLFSGARC